MLAKEFMKCFQVEEYAGPTYRRGQYTPLSYGVPILERFAKFFLIQIAVDCTATLQSSVYHVTLCPEFLQAAWSFSVLCNF